MTIGVNISHDSSVCIKENNRLIFFEESRFNKIKHWGPTSNDFNFLSFKKIKKFNDVFVFASYGKDDDEDKEIINLIIKKYNIEKSFYNPWHHHIYHACSAFYVSKFNKAVCIVMDGGGAYNRPKSTFREADSIFYIDNSRVVEKYKCFSNVAYTAACLDKENKEKFLSIDIQDTSFDYFTKDLDNCEIRMTSNFTPGQLFNHLCSVIKLRSKDEHGLFFAEPGKAMGLSSYGNSFGKKDEDLAKQVQISTEKYTVDLIEKALTYSNTRNVILSGGYALNCVNNYKYTKHFKNINFFVDPCPHDGGTSLGAAVWYDHYR